MSKIVINATGSGGNFQPLLVLAKALKENGHSIRFATGSEDHRHSIEGNGIEYCPLSEFQLRREVLKNPKLTQRILRPQQNLKLVLQERVYPNLKRTYEELKIVCEGADLLISGVLPLAASLVHAKTQILWVSICLTPASFIPLSPLLRLRVNFWSKDWHLLRKELNLPACPDILQEGCHSPILQLAAFSRSFWPETTIWPSHRHHTGFIGSNYSQSEISVNLQAFLSQGESPIVFTMGNSLLRAVGEHFFDICIVVLKKMKLRGIFVCGDLPAEKLEQLRKKNNIISKIIITGAEPFSKLFPYAQAVVHHGGIGTIGEALKAGLPMLIIPIDADNPQNANQVTKLGCGVQVSIKSFSSRSLEKAITRILRKQYRQKSVMISKEIINENGVSKTMSYINNLLAVSKGSTRV